MNLFMKSSMTLLNSELSYILVILPVLSVLTLRFLSTIRSFKLSSSFTALSKSLREFIVIFLPSSKSVIFLFKSWAESISRISSFSNNSPRVIALEPKNFSSKLSMPNLLPSLFKNKFCLVSCFLSSHLLSLISPINFLDNFLFIFLAVSEPSLTRLRVYSIISKASSSKIPSLFKVFSKKLVESSLAFNSFLFLTVLLTIFLIASGVYLPPYFDVISSIAFLSSVLIASTSIFLTPLL